MKNLIKTFVIVIILISQLKIAAQPVVNVSPDSIPNNVDKYSLLQFPVTIDTNSTTYNNPYDPDQIDLSGVFISPSNKVYKINGFYYQDVNQTIYECNHDKPDIYCDSCEKLDVVETSGRWLFRFTPNEIGEWRFICTAKDVNGESAPTDTVTFNCVLLSGNTEKGFIRPNDSRSLKFDNGDIYFPIGINLPAAPRYLNCYLTNKEHGTILYKEYMDTMNVYNINHYRLEINMFRGFNLYGIDLRSGDNWGQAEDNYYAFFNQGDAWQLDEVISYAKQHDITLSLAINSWQDFGDSNYSEKFWKRYNPYNQNVEVKPNNPDYIGSCSEQRDFFDLSKNSGRESLRVQKNLFRYIFARWGYATNILAFDVWDEADNVPNHIAEYYNLPDDERRAYKDTFNVYVKKWHDTVMPYIQSIVPYNHMVTSGVGGFGDENLPFFTSPLTIDNFDCFEIHRYPNYCKNRHIDASYKIFETTQEMFKYYDMPFVIGEFKHWRAWNNPNYPTIYQADPNLYEVHNILWSSIFSGLYGTAQFWQFRSILENAPMAFQWYIGVSNFVNNNFSVFNEDYKPIFDRNSGVKNDYRAVYLKRNDNNSYMGWVQDTNFTFTSIYYDSLQMPYLNNFDTCRPTESSNSAAISVAKQGNYKVSWYNTFTGNKKNDTSVFAEFLGEDNLEMNIPISLHKGIWADAAFTLEYQCEYKWWNSPLNINTKEYVRDNANIACDNYGQPFFISGNDNKVHIMWNNGVSFRNYLLTDSSHVARSKYNGGSNIFIDNKNRVYFIADESNRIYRLYYDWENDKKWKEELPDNQHNNVRSNSNIQVYNKNYSIYFIGNDNKVHVLWLNKDTGKYEYATISNIEVAATSTLGMDDIGRLYFIGSEKGHEWDMYRLYWDWEIGDWVDEIIANAENTNIRNFSPIIIRKNDYRIYYVGNDAKVHEKRIVNSNYVDAILAKLDNYSVTANSGLGIDSKKRIFFTESTTKRINLIKWSQNAGHWVVEQLGDAYNNNKVNYYLAVNNLDQIYYASNDNNKIYIDYFDCDGSSSKSTTHKNYDMNLDNLSTFKSHLMFNNNNVLKENTKMPMRRINVYPNPAHEDVTIEFEPNEYIKDIVVSNIYGSKIIKHSTRNNKYTFSVKNLQKGMYIISVDIMKEHIVRKLIIN